MVRRIYELRALRWAGAVAMLAVWAGCGTTRTTDTSRTATEQLLVSDAIDRSIGQIDFGPLAGQSVYLDDTRLDGVVDRGYLVGTLRQHLLASGCILRDQRDEAEFVVEARAGAVGTDRNDLLFGIPATNIPQVLPLQTMPSAIPEVPLAKRRDQRGIAKVMVFAYHRPTGRPVWQSGLARAESSSNDVWLFGAGPFQYGTVKSGPTLAALRRRESAGDASPSPARPGEVELADAAVFASPAQLAEQASPQRESNQVVQATSEQPVATERRNTSTPQPAPFTAGENAAVQQLLPNLAKMAAETNKDAKKRGELTARVFDAPMLRSHSTTTVEAPPSEVDPVPLPQPRFGSP